ncbi:hypothetical protein A9266_24180 [Vibrio tasmaniensis]|nr:hypothetical protein A9266_24180 [Vibrio tasmaniensis]
MTYFFILVLALMRVVKFNSNQVNQDTIKLLELLVKLKPSNIVLLFLAIGQDNLGLFLNILSTTI